MYGWYDLPCGSVTKGSRRETAWGPLPHKRTPFPLQNKSNNSMLERDLCSEYTDL